MTRKPIRYRYFWFLFILLVACGRQQDAAPTETLIPTVVSPTLFPTSTVIPITDTPHTATFPAVPLPNDLVVAYVVEDALWIWTQNGPQVLLQQQNISAPIFSDDGQWILFRQRHISLDGINPTLDELWVARTDGSEIERLVGSDDLMALTGKKVLMDYFSWLPGQNKILFQTEAIIDGPPGSWPLFNLYSLDLSGQIAQLIEPGEGGRFVSSPDGSHVALVTDSKLGILDLKTGAQRTLLEFEPVGFPSDGGLSTPKAVWDPYGQFVVTSILPQNLYYPEKYAGEPTQVWRMFVNGQIELIAELQLVARFAGVDFSPNLQYLFYLDGSCVDGMGMLFVRNLESGEESPLSCVWELPQWAPDSEHFIYELDWLWQLGSISEKTNQPLDVLNIPTDPDVHASLPLTWINDEYFLLVLRSSDACTLNIATLQGRITEITRTPPDNCLRGVTFSLAKRNHPG